MGRVEYACTHILKTACETSYIDGPSDRSRCLMDQSSNITAGSLGGLFGKIGRFVGFQIREVFVRSDDAVNWVDFDSLENGDGESPTEYRIEKWKAGNATLYVAKYSFLLEKRTVEDIPRDELAAAIKIST